MTGSHFEGAVVTAGASVVVLVTEPSSATSGDVVSAEFGPSVADGMSVAGVSTASGEGTAGDEPASDVC